MSVQLFDPRILASFLIGGIWIVITTLAADRFGSKIGGLLGGLPSTVLVALFFIGLTLSPQEAALATTVVPLGMGLNGAFLVAYAAFARWGFPIALGGAFSLWLLVGGLCALLLPQSYALSLLIFGLLLIADQLAFERWLGIHSSPGVRLRFSPAGVVGRGLLGGLMIGVSVVLARLAGPRLGGLFASMPSVFIATITIGYLSRGLEFSRTVAKPLMLSGMINVTAYASAVRVFYPILGLWLGTLASFAIAVLSSLLTYQFIRRRMA